MFSLKKLFIILVLGFFPFSVFSSYDTEPLKLQLSSSSFSYHLQGDANAPKVFLLGGGPGFSSWNLEPIQTKIAEMGYRVYLTDMFGIGENRHIQPAPVIDTWVAQLDAVIDAQLADKEQIVLIGHSWGALMAMLYAREHSERVSKIILVNPVDPDKASMQNLTVEIHARNQENATEDWDSEAAWSNSSSDLAADIERITLRQIQQVLPTYFMDYDLGVKYASQFTTQDFNIDLNVQTWKEYDANSIQLSSLKKTPYQLSFIECNQDYLMPYNLNAMKPVVPFTELDLIDQCGHFPWIEQADKFYPILKKQIDSAYFKP